jgi:aarF domain-containing kinase
MYMCACVCVCVLFNTSPSKSFANPTNQIELLDFGAARTFPDRFVGPYVRLLRAASERDAAACLALSTQLGYLTGHESDVMRRAHLDSLFVLAEPFYGWQQVDGNNNHNNQNNTATVSTTTTTTTTTTTSSGSSTDSSNDDDYYDFSNQTVTARIRALIPVMLRHRLTPPPEETYSLHRKLSGAFLLLARLRARVPCRQLFRQAMRRAEAQEQQQQQPE